MKDFMDELDMELEGVMSGIHPKQIQKVDVSTSQVQKNINPQKNSTQNFPIELQKKSEPIKSDTPVSEVKKPQHNNQNNRVRKTHQT
jgi:hypothetical protein